MNRLLNAFTEFKTAIAARLAALRKTVTAWPAAHPLGAAAGIFAAGLLAGLLAGATLG
jgi:hypothetical protein